MRDCVEKRQPGALRFGRALSSSHQIVVAGKATLILLGFPSSFPGRGLGGYEDGIPFASGFGSGSFREAETRP
jgi:hypothetical protein